MSKKWLGSRLAIAALMLVSAAVPVGLPLLSSTPALATSYSDQTLPTLRRGDRGESVRMLQELLQSNGFLGAAARRLGQVSAGRPDGIFGAVTESAIRDLQQRYDLPVTGVVNPVTWEVLDQNENPYRAPLPWRY